MKYNNYIVTFVNARTVFVTALSEDDAIILASAVMIRNAMDKEVYMIEKVEGISAVCEYDFVA